MSIRILHCGDNLQNYYLCIEMQVAGFIRLSPVSGDLIYLCVKVNGISHIGARGIIGEPTTLKPWPNSRNYKFSYTLKNMEYCKPFDIQPLSRFGGSYWAAKYLQASKVIKDEEAVRFLEEEFGKNKTLELIRL